jgi:hypothetical protein
MHAPNPAILRFNKNHPRWAGFVAPPPSRKGLLISSMKMRPPWTASIPLAISTSVRAAASESVKLDEFHGHGLRARIFKFLVRSSKRPRRHVARRPVLLMAYLLWRAPLEPE